MQTYITKPKLIPQAQQNKRPKTKRLSKIERFYSTHSFSCICIRLGYAVCSPILLHLFVLLAAVADRVSEFTAEVTIALESSFTLASTFVSTFALSFVVGVILVTPLTFSLSAAFGPVVSFYFSLLKSSSFPNTAVLETHCHQWASGLLRSTMVHSRRCIQTQMHLTPSV